MATRVRERLLDRAVEHEARPRRLPPRDGWPASFARSPTLPSIRSAYSPEQLVGRYTVVVANLAPRTMKFGVSEGMVLSAGWDDPTKGAGLFLLDVHDGAQPGMKVK